MSGERQKYRPVEDRDLDSTFPRHRGYNPGRLSRTGQKETQGMTKPMKYERAKKNKTRS
jgi:hypothetical protein